MAGCGHDRSLGGGATETENGMHWRLVSHQGQPASFASARFVRTDTWMHDLATRGRARTIETVADEHGVVSLDSLGEGTWSLQAEWGSEALIAAVGPDTGTPRLRLGPVSRVIRKLSRPTDAELSVVGTDWRSAFAPTGEATLYLPAGSHGLASRTGTSLAMAGVARIRTWEASEESISIDPLRVVLDDFGSGSMNSTFHSFSGFGNWYSVSNAATSMGSLSFQDQLTLRFSLSDTTNAYAIAGISFVDARGYHAMDLSAMDSLCFDARGTSSFHASIQQIGSASAVLKAVSATTFGPSTNWSHRCLTPGSFGAGWENIKSQGNDLAFVATRGDLLELRDIVLWGVPLSVLVP